MWQWMMNLLSVGTVGNTMLAVFLDFWLADSMCTLHIAWDHEMFVDYIPTPGHQISGFGKAPGLGRGTIRLEGEIS
jgi:hypothetical protein